MAGESLGANLLMAAYIRESSDIATADEWFDTVSTPDTVFGD